jgi:predicted nucleotidyltransferase
MNANDPNVELLEVVAEHLGEALREELVFVGGAVAGLLITDPATPAIRSTQDVDVICSAVALADYYRICRQLRSRGFVEDQRAGAPTCRWRIGELAVDVMPTRSDILGFANRWYPLAVSSAQVTVLPNRVTIRLVTAPVFVATKLEAFHGRGQGDFLFSHDLEDLIAIVDGRSTLLEECRESSPELRAYLAQQLTALLAEPAFVEALSGHLPGDAASQQRLPGLQKMLRLIADL